MEVSRPWSHEMKNTEQLLLGSMSRCSSHLVITNFLPTRSPALGSHSVNSPTGEMGAKAFAFDRLVDLCRRFNKQRHPWTKRVMNTLKIIHVNTEEEPFYRAVRSGDTGHFHQDDSETPDGEVERLTFVFSEQQSYRAVGNTCMFLWLWTHWWQSLAEWLL